MKNDRQSEEESPMRSGKRKVRYEEMLPHELEEAVAVFPVAYCPFGSL